uniref:Nf-x1-type zinc finger protein nfxl2-like n=1 Tax=Tetraselmis sp. GSL018 TaxID=582737 RepID=A0A061QPI7_9CHLO
MDPGGTGKKVGRADEFLQRPASACDGTASRNSSNTTRTSQVLSHPFFENYYSQWDETRSGLLAEEEDCTEGFSALERIEEHLLSTKEGASVCLVCLETIGAADATWHCRQSCFAVMHLQCIQSWAQQQLTSARARAEERRRLFPNEPAGVDVSWDCPKCRQPYPPGEVPCDYFCFCGKERDPEFDPWKVPHSCGEVCGRHLQTGCSHTCVLLCHPGPCPPCPRMVDMACHCGRSILRQRCGRAAFSCMREGAPLRPPLPRGVPRRRVPALHAGGRAPLPLREGEAPPRMLGEGLELRPRLRGASAVWPPPLREGLPCGPLRDVWPRGRAALPLWEGRVPGPPMRRAGSDVRGDLRAAFAVRDPHVCGAMPSGPLPADLPQDGCQVLQLRKDREGGPLLH